MYMGKKSIFISLRTCAFSKNGSPSPLWPGLRPPASAHPFNQSLASFSCRQTTTGEGIGSIREGGGVSSPEVCVHKCDNWQKKKKDPWGCVCLTFV